MSSDFTADPKVHLSQLLRVALASVAPDHADAEILLERPRDASHGDFASNLAMQLARALKENPRKIAERLMHELPASVHVQKVEIAGAGFLNFTLAASAKTQVVHAVLAAGENYGRVTVGAGKKVQVEFVSANPTGPLHVGHGRGAAYGASLSSLLDFAGYQVTREYYVNDAGRQMDILGVSTWLRYLELAGVAVPFPPNGYQGDYVKQMAQQLRELHGEKLVRSADEILRDVVAAPVKVVDVELTKDEKAQLETRLDGLIEAAKRLLADDWFIVHGYALNEQLSDGRADLAEFGVHFDVWYSEKSLYDTGLVAKAVAELEKRGHIYLQNGAKWFRSTTFGDEKDRVVQRDNGIYTYFASDIAYHLNKVERGFDKVIDVWGADHHGYICRVKGAMQALDLDSNVLEVTLVQFVSLFRDGVKASMSTRSGEFVTLRDLRQEVGVDACRFFYMLRKQDQSLDFDLDLAKSQSTDNPVYYVQYAHARICSVLNQWEGELASLGTVDLLSLSSERELALCARLTELPKVIELAARDHAPHSVAFYLKDLAADFHGWYNSDRVLVEDEAVKQARLALALATRYALVNGLKILGVSAPESM